MAWVRRSFDMIREFQLNQEKDIQDTGQQEQNQESDKTSTTMVSGKVTDIHTEVTTVKDSLTRAMEELKNKESCIESLGKELAESKESEKTMHDLLLAQTMEFEKTKVSLEESKQEIKVLLENLEKHESSSEVTSQSSTVYDHSLVESLENELRLAKEDLARSEAKAESLADQVNVWKNELMNTIEAEENNKKAMDELALALKEVVTESSQIKDELSSTKKELEATKKEVGELKVKLKKAEERCLDERREADRQKNIAERLRSEADETLIARNDQAKGFIECIKKVEFERNFAQAECSKLQESLKQAGETISRSKEEIQRLRDIMKQALTEANVAKEAASIAREENAQLKDVLAQKEEALKLLYQESERRAKSKAGARSRSPARKTALMTMKQYSEMEDPEQGKEHNDHDKESEQPSLRPRRSPSPLPTVRRAPLMTMRQYSESENSEQGKEQNEHDKEGEHPTLRPRRSPSPLLMVRKARLTTMKQYSEMEGPEHGMRQKTMDLTPHNDYDKESEQSAPKPRRLPSQVPATLTTVRMTRSMTNLKECPMDSAHHDKEHKDHDKELEQPDPRPLGQPLQVPETLTTMRMTQSMTGLKEWSEVEDPEQGKKPMDPANHDKEHNDYDKESEQPDPRPLEPPLPATLTTVRMTQSMTNLKEWSDMEGTEQGKKPMDSAHHDNEHKDHDEENEQPDPRPSEPSPPSPATIKAMESSEMEDSEHGNEQKPIDSTHHEKEQKDHDKEIEQLDPKPSPSPLPATMMTDECSEMEDHEQGMTKKPIDSTHDDNEQKDHDKESEQPAPKPSPLPETTTTNDCTEMEDSEQSKKPMDSAHHDKEHKDDDNESEQRDPMPSSPLAATTTTMVECLEMEDAEQGKKQTPIDSTHGDKEHKDHEKESEQPDPIPTTKECSEMEDHEQGETQQPMDSTHENKEHKDHDKESEQPAPTTMTKQELLSREEDEVDKLQKPMDPTLDGKEHKYHDKESEQPVSRLQWRVSLSRAKKSVSLTMKEFLALESNDTGKDQNPTEPGSTNSKPVDLSSSSTHQNSEPKYNDKEAGKKERLKPFIFPTNSSLVMNFPHKQKCPEDETRIPPTGSDDGSDSDDFDPLKGSIFDIAETPKTEEVPALKASSGGDLTNTEEANLPEPTLVEEEADKTRTRKFISKIGGLIGYRSFYYRREPPPLE